MRQYFLKPILIANLERKRKPLYEDSSSYVYSFAIYKLCTKFHCRPNPFSGFGDTTVRFNKKRILGSRS